MNFRPTLLFSMLLALVLSLAATAAADDWILTGSGIRTKSVGPFTANVYSIRHDIKAPAPPKAKQAVIDADVDKKFTWQMMRDVDSTKIQKALREAFQMNGYGDQAKINAFVGAFNKEEVKEKSAVVISYNAANKSVSIWVQNVPGKTDQAGSATINGADFMKAVWSIWFGKIDQPSLGDQLISKL